MSSDVIELDVSPPAPWAVGAGACVSRWLHSAWQPWPSEQPWTCAGGRLVSPARGRHSVRESDEGGRGGGLADHLLPLRGDKDLAQRAIDHFILAPYRYGWDRECGGLYYFLDSEGHSPTQLEWSMKLWWVHCEAMVALLMAFRSSREASIWGQFTQLCDLTFSKVRRHALARQWRGITPPPLPACSPTVCGCWPGGVVWLPHQGVEDQPEIQRRALQRSPAS